MILSLIPSIHANENVILAPSPESDKDNPLTWGTMDLRPMSPLKQIKSGIALVDVQCNNEKYPAIRYDKMRVACVSLDTESKLVMRGWATMRLAMPGDNISEALCNNYGGKWHPEYDGCRDISDLQCSLIGGKLDVLKICEDGICPDQGYEICVTGNEFENEHGLTTIKIEIGNPIDNRGLVPIITTQTTYIESLDEIVAWDFQPTDYGTWGANGERTSWDVLPTENRIYFDISGKNGSDTVKLDWSPVRPDSLDVNFATCEDESIEMLSGAPVSLPIPNGLSSISVSNSVGGLLPVNNQYTLSFASFFKHEIVLPDNAVVLSEIQKNCVIKDGDYTTGNLNRITFKLENEN